ncbi:MAG: hypothetical protein H7144_07765 [Burkholderiales bacterium]|nr:hypothetical protein [Phycisphaerae bacterium]
MFQKSIIAAAVALYAVVVGCTLIQSSTAPSSSDAKSTEVPTTYRATLAEGLPFRAVTLQIQRVDWIDKYKQSIDEIADVGADAVKFVVDARQENGSSSRIYLDMRMTPTPQQLSELIQYARKKNLRVILMPIVLLDAPRGTEWRGRIEPESWEKWWESYREMLNHFAWIAAGNSVDVLVVGSELVSTEKQIDEWTKTIEKVRHIFPGKLTYSSNWDHYTAVKFWDQLDFIGMNSYWTLGKTRDASVDEIKKNWQKIQKELFAFQSKVRKPIFFLEVGWCSMANMAYEPWDYTKDEDDAPTDVDLQKRLYDGFFESWHGRPELGGFSIWVWSPNEGGPDDRDYTPKGKPAEAVLRNWLAKKW